MAGAKESTTIHGAGWSSWAGPLSLPIALVSVNLWLLSDARWVDAMVEQAVQSSSGERAEVVRSAMNFALDSGALGIVVAASCVCLLVRSHILFVVIFFPIIGFFTGRWALVKKFAWITNGSLSILSVGIGLNGLLRWWCIRSNATFSAAFFLDPYDARNIWHDMALKLDLFLLLFFVRVARIAVHVFGGQLIHFIGLMLALWVGLTLASHLLGVPFELTF
jgi:hypothetical protein